MRDLRRQGGDRLERKVPAARGDAHSLAQDLPPVCTDVDVGSIAAQRSGEHRGYPDRLVLRLAGM
jgi:hypothetical protein